MSLWPMDQLNSVAFERRRFGRQGKGGRPLIEGAATSGAATRLHCGRGAWWRWIASISCFLALGSPFFCLPFCTPLARGNGKGASPRLVALRCGWPEAVWSGRATRLAGHSLVRSSHALCAVLLAPLPPGARTWLQRGAGGA
jgi:hypothetical protein